MQSASHKTPSASRNRRKSTGKDNLRNSSEITFSGEDFVFHFQYKFSLLMCIISTVPKDTGKPSVANRYSNPNPPIIIIDRPPTEGAKITSRPASTQPGSVQPATKLIYTEIGGCINLRDNSRDALNNQRPSSRALQAKPTKIPVLCAKDKDGEAEDNCFSGSATNPIMIPSTTTIVPIRTDDEISRLITGLRIRYGGEPPKKRVLETEKKKEVLSESSNTVTKDNSKTIENNVEENTEIFTETISNPNNSKSMEKTTKIVKKTDSSTIKDTNFTQTIVKRSNVEVVTETRVADDFMMGF